MARLLLIDGIDVQRVQLTRDSSGEVHVFAEFQLKSGNTTVLSQHKQIGPTLTPSRRAAIAALFDLIANDVRVSESV